MRDILLRLIVSVLTAGIGIAFSSFHLAQCHAELQIVKTPGLPLDRERHVSATEVSDPDCPPAYERRYFNYDYAYSVAIPKGMIGYGACHTNHGFGIDLSNPTGDEWRKQEGNPNAFLVVDASYNAGDLKSFDEAIKQSMQFLSKEMMKNIALVSVTRTHLARLPAVRYVIHYNQAGAPMVEDQVIAFRKKSDEEIDILYSIELKTSQSRYAKDREVLSWIQNTWRLHRLP